MLEGSWQLSNARTSGEEVSSRRRSPIRFRLLAILECTAVVAFVLTYVSGAGNAFRTFEFDRLPENDAALLAWLEENGYDDVTVTREGVDWLRLDERIGLWGVWPDIRNTWDNFPQPPWQELGYPAPQTGLRGAVRWSIFSRPSLWLSGIAVLIVFRLIRRRVPE